VTKKEDYYKMSFAKAEAKKLELFYGTSNQYGPSMSPN
jgi:hypothetical protein